MYCYEILWEPQPLTQRPKHDSQNGDFHCFTSYSLGEFTMESPPNFYNKKLRKKVYFSFIDWIKKYTKILENWVNYNTFALDTI